MRVTMSNTAKNSYTPSCKPRCKKLEMTTKETIIPTFTLITDNPQHKTKQQRDSSFQKTAVTVKKIYAINK